MAALDRLPDELLTEILGCSCQNSLVNLSLTSRALHRFVTPALYRFVEYSDGEASERYGLPKSLNAYRDPTKRTKIFNPFQFSQTIKTSPEIASKVVGISFDYTKYDVAGLSTTIIQTLDILKSSILYLHISWETKLAKLIANFPVTSLSLLLNPSATIRLTALDDIYPIFQIPTLRHLSLEHLSRFIDGHEKNPMRKASLSPITSLRLPFRYDDLNHLTEVLTWPAALESFHIFALGGRHTFLTAQGLLRDLAYQKSSLTELFIDGNWTSGGYHPVGKQLLEFPNLRRLGLSQEFLLPSIIDNGNRATQTVPNLSLHEVLPPKLEEFQLLTAKGFLWTKDPSSESDSELSDEALELCNWLHEIVKHKKRRFQNLWRIALWQWQWGHFTVHHLPKRDALPGFVEGILGTVGLGGVLKEAGVEILHSTRLKPPLFEIIGN